MASRISEIRARHSEEYRHYNHSLSALASAVSAVDSSSRNLDGKGRTEIQAGEQTSADVRRSGLGIEDYERSDVGRGARDVGHDAVAFADSTLDRLERYRRPPPFPPLENPGASFGEMLSSGWSEVVKPVASTIGKIAWAGLKVAGKVLGTAISVGGFMAGLIGRSGGALANSFRKMAPPSSSFQGGMAGAGPHSTPTARGGALAGSGEMGAPVSIVPERSIEVSQAPMHNHRHGDLDVGHTQVHPSRVEVFGPSEDYPKGVELQERVQVTRDGSFGEAEYTFLDMAEGKNGKPFGEFAEEFSMIDDRNGGNAQSSASSSATLEARLSESESGAWGGSRPPSDYGLDAEVVAENTRRWEEGLSPQPPDVDTEELYWRREGSYRQHQAEMETQREQARRIYDGQYYS